jgi:hypothetical protein
MANESTGEGSVVCRDVRGRHQGRTAEHRAGEVAASYADSGALQHPLGASIDGAGAIQPETHESKTDPEARLYRKGNTASELRYKGHALTANRDGLVVNACLTRAEGHAEREAAKVMTNDARQVAEDANAEITRGTGKGYDAQEFIEAKSHVSAERSLMLGCISAAC